MPSNEDVVMGSEPAPPRLPSDNEPKYGGFTRFEMELEAGLYLAPALWTFRELTLSSSFSR
jgi:hypothetical protein